MIPKPGNPQSSIDYSVAQKASANVAKAEKTTEMVYGEIFLRAAKQRAIRYEALETECVQRLMGFVSL